MLSRSGISSLSQVNQDTASNKSTLARLTVTGNLLSGAVARVAVGFILSPITVVKARFESSHFSKESYPSLGRALKEIYQTGGSRGFLRGFSATALRDAPYAGLYLAIYEKAKDTFAFVQGDEDRGSSLVVSLSGALWNVIGLNGTLNGFSRSCGRDVSHFTYPPL